VVSVLVTLLPFLLQMLESLCGRVARRGESAVFIPVPMCGGWKSVRPSESLSRTAADGFASLGGSLGRWPLARSLVQKLDRRRIISRSVRPQGQAPVLAMAADADAAAAAALLHDLEQPGGDAGIFFPWPQLMSTRERDG
jgi:hypothetical protein